MALVGNRELILRENLVPELLGSGNSFQNALARKRALFALLWRDSVLDVFALAPKRAFICLLWLESVLVF